MHIALQLSCKSPIILNSNYNEAVQGFIYNNINKELKICLNEQGLIHNKQQFRLFCFSRLLGKFTLNKECHQIEFTSPIKLVITTPVEFFAHSIAKSVAERPNLYVQSNRMEFDRCTVSDNTLNTEGDTTLQVNTLSPVVVCNTVEKPDGKKFTHYHSPADPAFTGMLKTNLVKKAELLKIKAASGNFNMLLKSVLNERVIHYKNFAIKGYEALIELKGDPALINVALSCGLGSKNSQGFGCIEPVKK